MNNPNLRTRTAYTFFESLLKIEDILIFAENNGYKNAMIVDKNNLYGAMEFYKKAIAKNINPIIGLEIDYQGINKIVFALNYQGYKNLLEMSSQIMLEKTLDLSLINDDIYLLESEQPIISYVKSTDWKTLEMFSSIANKTLDKKQTSFLTREEYELTIPTADLNMIDDLCTKVDIQIPLQVNILPDYISEDKAVDANTFLKELLLANLKALAQTKNLKNVKKYIARMKHEFGVIAKMKFEAYFLIVWDIVMFARKNNIRIGPGRGSAPGSLVSYLLGITQVDPLKNGLLFERFLNSERVSMPDIDVDIEDIRRQEVIEYVAEKYGYDNVAQIITFQVLRSKSAIKDICRIKGINITEAESITKLIPDFETLEDSYRKNKKFRLHIESKPIYKEIFESAKLIEGLPRQFSTHAAGIVLSNNPIYESVPTQKGFGKLAQTQYTMNYMEENGLLKIDLLGLKTLSFINQIIHLIKVNHNLDYELDVDNLDDKLAYKLLAEGKTGGIFQLESPGMTKILKQLNVSCFEDIVATTSLYRPGPMQNIPAYIKRKQGQEKVEYLDDDLEPILKSTYGIIIYQEQIMQIAQVYAGFSLTKADILRRAIGKKDITLIEKLEDKFYSGAKELGHKFEHIQEVYALIYKFAEYGFNRSHAFAYSVISYNLALLKAKFPSEFMAALLTSVIGNSTKTAQYIKEANELGIKVEIPSINEVGSNFIIRDKVILLSLRTIKGVGETAVRRLIAEREENGSFNFLLDFFARMKQIKVSKSTIESIIKAGLLDEFDINRNTVLENGKRINDYLDLIKVNQDGQVYYDFSIKEPPKLETKSKANYEDFEKQVFGFVISKAPQSNFKNNSYNNKNNNIEEINSINNQEQNQNGKIFITGNLLSVKRIINKQNKEMAFATIENDYGKTNLTLFPGIYAKYQTLLKPGNGLIVEGKIDLTRQETIIVSEIREI